MSIAIADGLTMLELLDMSDCPYIDDEGIFAIANGLTMLKSFHITESLLSNDGVIAIANGLTMLESLTISESSCITEEGVTTEVIRNGALTNIWIALMFDIIYNFLKN